MAPMGPFHLRLYSNNFLTIRCLLTTDHSVFDSYLCLIVFVQNRRENLLSDYVKTDFVLGLPDLVVFASVLCLVDFD